MGRAGQALLLAALALLPAMLGAQQPMKTIAERLGYPRDSKLLIIHADGLVVRLPGAPPELLAMLTEKDIVLDGIVMMNAQVPPERWKEWYLQALRSMKPGLNELIVHLGYDDAEIEAISVDHPDFGAVWRQRDFDLVTNPEFRKALEENHIIVVGWKDVKKIM